MVVIEHNLDVIKTADWVIDIGPEGGDGGGRIVAEGTPEQVAAVKESYTGRFLGPLLRGQAARRPQGALSDRGGGRPAPALLGRRQGRTPPSGPDYPDRSSTG